MDRIREKMRRQSDVVRKTKLCRTMLEMKTTLTPNDKCLSLTRQKYRDAFNLVLKAGLGGVQLPQTADNTTAGSGRHKQNKHTVLNHEKGTSNLAGIELGATSEL